MAMRSYRDAVWHLQGELRKIKEYAEKARARKRSEDDVQLHELYDVLAEIRTLAETALEEAITPEMRRAQQS